VIDSSLLDGGLVVLIPPLHMTMPAARDALLLILEGGLYRQSAVSTRIVWGHSILSSHSRQAADGWVDSYNHAPSPSRRQTDRKGDVD
jgi:hypothetical protein